LAYSPWSRNNWQWIPSAGWIVFPTIALLISALVLLRSRGNKERGLPLAFCAAYLFECAVLVFMTLRPNHILEFDYFASILLPMTFLILGLTLFEIPDRWEGPQLYVPLILCCVICVIPLSKRDLYQIGMIGGTLAFSYITGLSGVGVRLLWPR